MKNSFLKARNPDLMAKKIDFLTSKILLQVSEFSK